MSAVLTRPVGGMVVFSERKLIELTTITPLDIRQAQIIWRRYAPLRYANLLNGVTATPVQKRTAFDNVLIGAFEIIQALARRLLNGSIALEKWVVEMAVRIKRLHVMAYGVAMGGFGGLTQDERTIIALDLRRQDDYLFGFERAIDQTPGQWFNDRIVPRAQMYVEAARRTYEDAIRREKRRNGFDQERRVLGVAEHCDDCLTYAGLNWQPIGTLPPIGDSECRSSCHCMFVYRVSQPAMIAE